MTGGVVASLVESARDGDEGAWRELVDRYLDLVWSVARSHGLSQCDAADVAQTTWLRLSENLGRLAEPSRVGAWLATTARREALRVARARRREIPMHWSGPELERTTLLAVTQAGDDPLEEVGGSPDSRLLSRAFGELTPTCQRLLRMLVAEPRPSYAEVSAALEMPIGSIGPTRARCLDRLRASVLSLSAFPRAVVPGDNVTVPGDNVTVPGDKRRREVS